MMKLCPDVFPSTWVNPVLNYRRSATLTDPHPTATRQYVPKASHHPPNGGNSNHLRKDDLGRLFHRSGEGRGSRTADRLLDALEDLIWSLFQHQVRIHQFVEAQQVEATALRLHLLCTHVLRLNRSLCRIPGGIPGGVGDLLPGTDGAKPPGPGVVTQSVRVEFRRCLRIG